VVVAPAPAPTPAELPIVETPPTESTEGSSN